MMQVKFNEFHVELPGGAVEARKSSKALRWAVVAAQTAPTRAAQLEASISRHRAEAAADLRNDGFKHPSAKEAARVAGIRDAETVADVEKLAAVRALGAEELVEPTVWGWYEEKGRAIKGLEHASRMYDWAQIRPVLPGLGERDTPGGKVGVVFPTGVMFNSPNAADKPGGTDQGDKMNNVKLTAKETLVLDMIATGAYSFFDQGLETDSGIWTDCLTGETVGTAVSETRRGVASVVNSLSRKGMIEQSTNEDGAWIAPTEAFQLWAIENHPEAPLVKHLLEAHPELAPAAEVVEEAPAAVEVPVLKLSGEMVEVPSDSIETAKAEAEAIEAPAAEVKAPKAPRKPKLVVVETAPEALTAPVGPGEDSPVKWGMGTHTAGDTVISKDGLEWTVIGPAEKGKTVRLERTVDGAVKVRLSFHYNITKK